MGVDARHWRLWIERLLLALGVACFAWWGVVSLQATRYQYEQRAALERMRGAAPAVANDSAVLPSGSLIGSLEIPRIRLSAVIAEGDDDATLKVAIGHLPDTPMPWHDGNSAFAGHRDTFFRSLRHVRVGDELRVSTGRGDFRYQVRETMVVGPNDVWVLDPTEQPTLTLITCYPFGYVGKAPRRFIVRAERTVTAEPNVSKGRSLSRLATVVGGSEAMRTINRLAISAALILCALGVQSVDAFAESPKNQNYVWFGEVVMYDEKGKTVTVEARYREHINRYIGDFKVGDRVMLNWATPRPGETEAITYVGPYDANSAAKWGYVLPVEFVSADTTKRRLRFTVPVPSKAVKALKRTPSGGWIKVTTPFDQPHETAAIVAVEPSVEPQDFPPSGGREERSQGVPQL